MSAQWCWDLLRLLKHEEHTRFWFCDFRNLGTGTCGVVFGANFHWMNFCLAHTTAEWSTLLVKIFDWNACMRLELTDTNVKRTFLVCVSIYTIGIKWSIFWNFGTRFLACASKENVDPIIILHLLIKYANYTCSLMHSLYKYWRVVYQPEVHVHEGSFGCCLLLKIMRKLQRMTLPSRCWNCDYFWPSVLCLFHVITCIPLICFWITPQTLFWLNVPCRYMDRL